LLMPHAEPEVECPSHPLSTPIKAQKWLILQLTPNKVNLGVDNIKQGG